ncbi:MAG TPA: hypothetical protein VH253_17150 [Phycisphaerae bacterium]|nr:hypothetical protein [Phycisphaerae bacterium]
MKWRHALLIAAALAAVAQAAPPAADAPVSSVLTGPALPETDPAALRAQVADVLRRLASPEFKERQKAQADVADLPFQAMALVTAASEDPAVDPEVRDRLKEALPVYEKKSLATAAAADLDRRRVWRLQMMLSEYQKAGRHDPAWDAKVHDAILADNAAPQPGANERVQREHVWHLYQAAIAAGCHDPLVLLRAADMATVTDHDQGVARAHMFQQAADAFDASDYSPFDKIESFLRGIESLKTYPNNDGQDAMRQQHYADLAIAAWPDLARTTGISDDILVNLALRIRAADPRYATEIQHQLLAALNADTDTSLPHARAAAKILAARFRLDAAMRVDLSNAVGARTLPPEFKAIRDLLQQAWAQDPIGYNAPTVMLDLEWVVLFSHEMMGDAGAPWPENLGTRGDMERWFTRAMAANPDNYDACSRKLQFLRYQPGDHAADMLAFGRQMLATHRWTGRVPMTLVHAHELLANASGSPENYFAQPAVWADIKSCYQQLMQHDPIPGFDACWYLKYAAYAGDWQTAADLCRQIGDHPAPAVFGGLQAYKDLRTKVFQRAGITTAPG